jgi:uncharacterized protein YceK
MIRLFMILSAAALLGGCASLTRSADDIETEGYFPELQEGRTVFNPKRIRETPL